MVYNLFFNIAAVFISLIATITLWYIGKKRIDSRLNTMINWLIGGIFLAVFVHSIFEMLNTLGWIDENLLILIMPVLVSLGSVCFIMSVVVGILKAPQCQSDNQ